MNSAPEFNSFCNAYCEKYLRELGERKFKTVLDKVMTSNKISGLISTSRYQMWRPKPQTILACLHEIPYFMFARNDTLALAGILTLLRWNEEANQPPVMGSDGQLREMAISILTELRCRV